MSIHFGHQRYEPYPTQQVSPQAGLSQGEPSKKPKEGSIKSPIMGGVSMNVKSAVDPSQKVNLVRVPLYLAFSDRGVFQYSATLDRDTPTRNVSVYNHAKSFVDTAIREFCTDCKQAVEEQNLIDLKQRVKQLQDSPWNEVTASTVAASNQAAFDDQLDLILAQSTLQKPDMNLLQKYAVGPSAQNKAEKSLPEATIKLSDLSRIQMSQYYEDLF